MAVATSAAGSSTATHSKQRTHSAQPDNLHTNRPGSARFSDSAAVVLAANGRRNPCWRNPCWPLPAHPAWARPQSPRLRGPAANGWLPLPVTADLGERVHPSHVTRQAVARQPAPKGRCWSWWRRGGAGQRGGQSLPGRRRPRHPAHEEERGVSALCMGQVCGRVCKRDQGEVAGSSAFVACPPSRPNNSAKHAVAVVAS